MRNLLLGCVAAACALLGSVTAAADPPGFKTLEIGAAAPDFKLPGVDDKEYTLKSFEDAKLLLLVFTCNHCPTAQAYEQRIMQLHADYRDKGVALVAISPNDAEAVRLDELGYSDVGDSLADDLKQSVGTVTGKTPARYEGLAFDLCAGNFAGIPDNGRVCHSCPYMFPCSKRPSEDD